MTSITNRWAVLTALCLAVSHAQAQDSLSGVPGQPPAVAPSSYSPGVLELARMAQSGITEDIMLAYVQSAATVFDLRAEGILYLKGLGVTPAVIKAVLHHDYALQNPGAVLPAAMPVVADPASAVAAAPPVAYDSAPPAQVTYFYNDLLPYGAWVRLDGVGWCWQPRAVITETGWRPYCHGGHWIWSDSGWYWESEYNWGWAPFHYGRWLRHESCGWVWIPDTVWGPGWVTWRVGDDACGWAPLPPHADFDVALGFRFNGVRVSASFDFGLRPEVFTFVALRDLAERDLDRRCLGAAEITRVYARTTVVNHQAVNHGVMNRGVAIDRVEAASHHQVARVTVRDLPAGATAAAHARPTNQAEPVVYRPRLAVPERPASYVAQKVDARHPVVNHEAATALSARTTSVAPPPSRSVRPEPRQPTPAPGVRTTGSPSVETSVRPAGGGRSGALGVEVFSREPGPSFTSQTSARKPSGPAMPENPHQYVPKTVRQENEQRPAAAAPAPQRGTTPAPAPQQHGTTPALTPQHATSPPSAPEHTAPGTPSSPQHR